MIREARIIDNENFKQINAWQGGLQEVELLTETSKKQSDLAASTAEEAKQKADNLRTEMNGIVKRETDSDAMSRQAAVNASGEDKEDLKVRLDDDYYYLNSKTDHTQRHMGHYESFSFEVNDLESDYFRIPAAVRTNDGTMINFVQAQYSGSSDYTHQDVAFSKSMDNGKTWEDKKIVIQSTNTDSRLLNPTVFYDEDENKILLIATEIFNTDHSVVWWKNTDDMWDTYLCESYDNGNNWSKRSIKDTLIASRQEHWTVCMPGLGSGIKMDDGTYAFAMEIGYDDGTEDKILNTLMYSANVTSWSLSNPTPELGDEANVVLLDSNRILLNARNYGTRSPKMRKIFYTDDIGETWKEHVTHQTIPENRATMGHTLSIDIEGEHYVLFSHMQSADTSRKELGISVLSHSETRWSKVEVVEKEEYRGYSFLVHNSHFPNELYIVYEKDGDIIVKNISYMLATIKAVVRATVQENETKTTIPFLHMGYSNETSVGTEGYHVLAYDTVTNDSSGDSFTLNADGSLTIEKAGVYMFNGLVTFRDVQNTPFVNQLELFTNGSASRRLNLNEFASDSGHTPINFVGYFSAGTDVEIRLNTNEAGTLRGSDRYNYLTVVKTG
ncbi:sialidase family protein [Marinococcus halophilus]|uniref:sialidase family protein n=1 Tax=Marinococcus halophilus TaxID=1371 RepID=UPI0015C460E1|nr:sialidase family protein [Marinococcus halophilus]